MRWTSPNRSRSSALAEGALDEAMAAYGHAVLTATTEAETALAGLKANRHRAAFVSSFAEEARAEAALQEKRYLSGVGDYATFLAAAQMDVGAKAASAAAERDLAYARLALHRSLGVAWSNATKTASPASNFAQLSTFPDGPEDWHA